MTTKTIRTANNNQESLSPSAELRDIRALLVLLLMKSGASQAEIGRALGVNQATVSRQFGIGTVKPLSAMTVSDEAVKE